MSDSLCATSTAYSTSIVVRNVTNTSSVVTAIKSTLAASTTTLTGTVADTIILQTSALSQVAVTDSSGVQVSQVLKVTAAVAGRVNLTLGRAEQLSQTYQTLTGSTSTTTATTLSSSDLSSAASALASLGHRAVTEVKTFSQAFGDAMVGAASNVVSSGALSTLNTYTASIQANLDTTVDKVASLSLGSMAPGQASQTFTAPNCRK